MNNNVLTIIDALKKEVSTATTTYQNALKNAEQYADEYKLPKVEAAQAAYQTTVVQLKEKAKSKLEKEREQSLQGAAKTYFKTIDSELVETLTLLERTAPTKKELEYFVECYKDRPLVLRLLADISKKANLSIEGLTIIPTLDQTVETIDSSFSLALQGVQSISDVEPNLENLTFQMTYQTLKEQAEK